MKSHQENVIPESRLAGSPRTILLASLIGTTVEFFDFFIFATAAVLVFPILYFPKADPASAQLLSLATFALAFFARPLGSIVFGHFGDRIGRRATLVAALLLMGISTIVIGLLPTYASIGLFAPVLLGFCRLGQGLGLGGEWGGAVLLATENAPPGKRAWYGMFPQLGAPLGFFISAGLYLALTKTMNNHVFLAWGWRIPFLSSAFLVCVGLWVRWHIAETPSFTRVIENHRRVRIPLLTVATTYRRALCLGTLTGFATFVLGYTSTVFVLGWGTSHLGYSRDAFLQMQLIVTGFYALGILVSAACADRYGKSLTMIVACVAIFLLGFFFVPLFATTQTEKVLLFLALTQAIMGLTYGPLSTVLANMFPAEARYTGASLAFNLAGILGAALAPYVSTWLTDRYGLASMGSYLSAAAVVSLGAFLASTSRSKVAT